MRTTSDLARHGVHLAVDEHHLDAFYRDYERRQREAMERNALPPNDPGLVLQARLMIAIIVVMAAMLMWLVCNG